MVYEPGKLEKESETLLRARGYAIKLLLAFMGIGLITSEANRLRTRLAEPLVVGYVLLAGMVGVLIWLWYDQTEHELRLLWKWLDPKRYAVPGSFWETLIILGMALVLIGMLFAARNPLWFGAVATCYNTAVLFSTRLVNRDVAKALAGSRVRVEEDMKDGALVKRAKCYARAIDAVDDYFLGNPHTLRHIIILVVALLGLALAVLWSRTGDQRWGLLAYALYIVNILVSEGVIAVWRVRRDRRLREVVASLSALRP